MKAQVRTGDGGIPAGQVDDQMRRKRMKKWKLAVMAVLFAVCYLIVGAVAPFMRYKEADKTKVSQMPSLKALSGRQTEDRAMLMETNLSAWEERIRLLSMAEERIIISTFDMRDGESTRDILAVLLHKADEGVHIRILVDGISGVIRMAGNKLFHALSSHPEVEIRLYNKLNILKPWKTQGRMHDKYVIVDDLAYFLGGRNTLDYFIGEYPTENRSYDREVFIYNGAHGREERSSSLFQVEAYFEQVWRGGECTPFFDEEKLGEEREVEEWTSFLSGRYDKLRREHPELFAPCDYASRTWPTEGVTLISGETGIYGKEPLVFEQLAQLMKKAKERVIIHTPYVVCNRYMYETLYDIRQKVPDARMVINSVENGDNFMASSDYLINKKDLVKTGIELYEYDGGESYHGKSIVIDSDISLIGSYNLDLRSTYMDTELMLMIKSRELTEELVRNMDVFQRDCRRVIDEEKYDQPEHIVVARIPLFKKAALRVVGVIMQAFRCLL